MDSQANKNTTSKEVLPHSRIGISAFALAEISFLFIVGFFIFEMVSDQENLSEEIINYGRILFRLYYFLLPLSSVLALISLSHSNRRRLFGAMALGTNILSLLLLLALLLF